MKHIDNNLQLINNIPNKNNTVYIKIKKTKKQWFVGAGSVFFFLTQNLISFITIKSKDTTA